MLTIFELQSEIVSLGASASLKERFSLLSRYYITCLSGDVLIYTVMHGKGMFIVPKSELAAGTQ